MPKQSKKATPTAKIYTEPVECRHCNNKTVLEVRASCAEDYSQIDDTGSCMLQEVSTYEILICPVCKKVSLRDVCIADYNRDYGPDITYLYPTSPERLTGLPTPIAAEYEAATKVRHISGNAYGVLIRRVLELVCEDKNAKGRNLKDKLDDLAQRKELPDQVAAIAHKLRAFGNVGAHASLGDIPSSEIQTLDELTRAVLMYVYSVPSLLDKAAKSLQKLKQ